MVSGYKQMFHLAATPQKKDSIHRGICFAYSSITFIHLKSEIPLFRPRIAVNAIFLFTIAQAASFPIKYTIESMVYCSHLPNMVEELAGG